jgi:hypothetical protein
LSNATLDVEVTCIDSWSQSNTSLLRFTLLPEPVCNSCEQTVVEDEPVQAATLKPLLLVIGIVFLALLLVLGVFLRKPKEGKISLWNSDQLMEDDFTSDDSNNSPLELELPTGWSREQYRIWLEGEMPEGWTLEQWDEFTDEQSELLKNQDF